MSNFASIDEVNATEISIIPSWIPKHIAPKVQVLKSSLGDVYKNLSLDDASSWRNYMQNSGWTEMPVNVTEFQKILVTQLLRPDCLLRTMTKVLTKLLGTPVPCENRPQAQHLATEGNADTPILYIAPEGSDASKEIEALSKKLREITIGNGDEVKAINDIKSAAQCGDWVCVKNVHLAPGWVKKLLEVIHDVTIDVKFRIWLIAETTEVFSSDILSRCNVVLIEPPNSIKAKTTDLIHQWNTILEKKKNARLIKLIVAAFLFDGVIRERSNYIPQGWTTSYDFSDADLRASINIILSFENSVSYKVDWKILRELLQSVAYGGRIKNDQDDRILVTNLEKFFQDKMFTSTWTPLHRDLVLPISYNIRDYESALQQLPDIDDPDILGLPMATAAMRESTLCKNILKNLRR